MEQEETEGVRHNLTFLSKDGRHTVTLHIPDQSGLFNVSIDNRKIGGYTLRDLTEEERANPKFDQSVAVLAYEDEGAFGLLDFGVCQTSKDQIEQKLKDLAG